MTEPEFPAVQPSISLHQFSEKLLETTVEFQVTRLQGQTIIWLGSDPARLSSLAAAVPGLDCPSTSLLPASEQSQALASRLARKLNKQVGISDRNYLQSDHVSSPLPLRTKVVYG